MTDPRRSTSLALAAAGISVGLAALSLAPSGCGRDESSVERARLSVQIRFAEGAVARPAERARIEQVRARAFEIVPREGSVLRAEAEDAIDPGETSFALSLAVPPAARYSILVEAIGSREDGAGASEFGLLHSGATLLEDLVAGETRIASIVLLETVPRIDLSSVPQVAYTVEWSEVEDAARYRLREDQAGVPWREFETAGTSRDFAFPPTFAPAALGPRLTYRVRAEFPDGRVSAYSESVGVTLPDPVAPARVVDLAAQALGPSEIELTWTAPGDDGDTGRATAYQLRRSLQPITEENFEAATELATNPPAPAGTPESLIAADLSGETTFFFALRASDETGLVSPLSNLASATTPPLPDLTPPAPVGDLAAATFAGTTARLGWTATGDDGAIGQAFAYDLRVSMEEITEASWATAAAVLGEPVPRNASERDSVTVTGLQIEADHWFALRVSDEAGNVSALSNVLRVTTLDDVAPAPIVDLVAAPVSRDEIRLSWTATGDDGAVGRAVAYEVRSALAPIDEESFGEAIAIEGAPAPAPAGVPEEWTVPGFSAGVTYWFALRATDNVDLTSLVSNTASATIGIPPPLPPTDLAATALSDSEIALEWVDASDDETAFELEVLPPGSEEFALLSTHGPDTTSRVLDGLMERGRYVFRVRAVNAGGASAYSNEASERTWPAPPVLDVAVATSPTDVVLGWTYAFPDPGAFEIERLIEDWEVVGTAAGSEREAMDGGLFPATLYSYRVRALDGGDRSAPSNVLDVRTDPAPAECQVNPPGLAFGTVQLQGSSDRTLEVQNVGGEDLQLTVALGAGCTEFELLSGGGAFILPPEASHGIVVRYRPEDEVADACSLELGTACPAVLCTGVGAGAPICRVMPTSLDFGLVDVGQFADRDFEISNLGNEQLSGVVSLPQGCDEFSLVSAEGYVIGPNDSQTFTVRYAPADSSVDLCVLDTGTLCSEDVSLRGEGTTDPDVRWWDGFAPPAGIDNAGFHLARRGSSLLVTGAFTDAGLSEASRIAEWDGGAFQALATDVSGTPWVIGVDPVTQDIVVGGAFQNVDGTNADNIVRRQPGGWSAMGLGLTGGGVWAMSQIAGGLVVGGDFLSSGSTVLGRVASWNGSVWSPLGSLDDSVYGLLQWNGSLYATGIFYPGTGKDRGIGRYVAATGQWVSLGDLGGTGYALEEWNNGLVVAGQFLAVSGLPASNIAFWNGATWSALGAGLDGLVYGLTVYHGDLVAVGSFQFSGSTPLFHVARWDGATWAPFGTGTNDIVFDAEVLGESLYIVGQFTLAGGKPAQNIARWDE